MTGTGRSSHFSRDILDIRLFSKDSGFSRMVEWAGTRRTGIRWKPYKDVAKASTGRRFHLGNLREHSIVAVITRIRGNRQLYLRFFFLTSFKFREQPKRNRFGFQNLCDAEASIDTRTLFLYSIGYFSSCDDSFEEQSNLHRIGERRERGGREIAISERGSKSLSRKGKSRDGGDCRLGKRVDSFTVIFVTSMIHIGSIICWKSEFHVEIGYEMEETFAKWFEYRFGDNFLNSSNFFFLFI